VVTPSFGGGLEVKLRLLRIGYIPMEAAPPRAAALPSLKLRRGFALGWNGAARLALRRALWGELDYAPKESADKKVLTVVFNRDLFIEKYLLI
jgi:hypothetical protein